MPFTPNNIGNMPQNQIDALPLFSADTAAKGGIISIFAGSFTRYLDGPTTGINGSAFATDANGLVFIVSDFMDLRGCRSFAILLRRAFVGVGALLQGINVWVQYRFTTAEVPLTSFAPAAANQEYLGMFLLGFQPITFPAFGAAGQVQTSYRGWNTAQASGVGGMPQSLGTDCRLVLIANGAIAATNTFTMTLWGAS